MPRLSDPRITQGLAASLLVELYLQEPEFVAEFKEVRRRHTKRLEESLTKALEVFTMYEPATGDGGYFKTFRDVWEAFFTPGRIPDHPTHQTKLLEEIKEISLQASPFYRDLKQLAHKWKLRAPWAGQMLHLYIVRDYLKQFGIPDECNVPFDKMDLMYPWPSPVPSLEIRVSAWAFVFHPRKEIQSEINKRLKDYEERLKALGLKEKPSALETHARWWFEHYVKGKTYREIAQQFLRVNEETIKRKVWEFSKLAGIKIR